jgi:O-antigen/teichoic acid export membrane protein
LMLGFPEEILRWTAGPEYVDGAAAVQILALALPLSFANQVFFAVHAAYHADRFLLAVASGALIITVALGLLLIPDYGFKAAAVVTVTVQAVVATVMGVFAARRYRVLPGIRYIFTVALAALPAIAVILFLPGPRLVVAAAALATYAIVVVLAPGTVRDEALRLRRLAAR